MDRRSFARALATALACRPAWAAAFARDRITVRPPAYSGALRNPLKGLRSGDPASAAKLPYASLAKSYLRWSDLERSVADGTDRIGEVCDAQWKGLRDINTKVVPRVYLDWPPSGHFWPADLPQGRYDTPQFQERAVAMIQKLGACWDNDPRVAFVETGLVGLWGEQHDPKPSASLQKAIGDAFVANFRHKLLMNRYPGDFVDYPFGIYWDSFAHKEELLTHLPLLQSPRLIDRWKTAPMGGETAFDWGTPLGKDPTDAVVHNADAIIARIRELHWNHLGWLSNYDQQNPQAVANAARIQEALGYRFVLREVQYPPTIRPGDSLPVSLSIENTGSSPLYYNWPLEVSLLDGNTRQPAWATTFPEVDLRRILPGVAGSGDLHAQFTAPGGLRAGRYLLALAILDPASGLPSARFATSAYFRGGRHPVGWVSVGRPASAAALPPFDDPASDTLHY
ncbi:DUF4832 domain-containing protein [Terriglobus aquaticus]|uniref:DUF4832 domain-containing protein n=1 Tax=Terriglobus aquaticus TaxID=940139 RepID=A0ABW9KNR3_9BACT|nr:DUF4832 domain-containing protein [Terriglobus aquaticus]